LICAPVHSVSLQTESYFRVDARVVAPTSEQPAAVFRERIVATVVGHQSTTAAPSLLHGRLAAGTGAYISLFLTTYIDKTGANTFTISIDLLLDDEANDWTPVLLGSKLRLWLDQRDLVTVFNAYSDWGDQAGDNGFIQTTLSRRPAAGHFVNYFAAPAFDGTTDFMGGQQLSDYVSANAYHVFVVLRVGSVSGTNPTVYLNHGVIADNDAGWRGLYLTAGSGARVVVRGFHWAGGIRQAVASGLETDTDALVEWSYDGTTIRCQVRGFAIATGVGGGNIGSLVNSVQLGLGATGGLNFDGLIAAAVVCNSHLTSTEVRNVREYLSSKYGVAS
jgi:hypothetical protein